MTDPTTTFLKRLKGITLSHNERLMLRQKLAAYTDMHPVVQGGAVRTPFTRLFAFAEVRHFSSFAMAALFVVVAGGGVTLAADTSVPGESLYSIKIHVNEPVMTALTPTATGQAKIAAEIATRRVDEAVILASRGTLTPERQAYLTQEFDTRAKIAAVKADDLASTGNSAASDTVKANFAANLAGEAQALGAITTKNSEQSADLLRAVVAVSEIISTNGTAEPVLAVAAQAAPEEQATSTPEATARTTRPVMTMAKMAAPVATTTSATTTSRYSKQLRVNGTSLRALLAPSASSAVMLPKTDVAIPPPAAPTPTSVEESGTAVVQ